MGIITSSSVTSMPKGMYMEDPVSCNWPANVPRTPGELEARWGKDINRWVHFYNKIQVNGEDLCQEVRKIIYKPDFCLKYVTRLEKSPDTMDTLSTKQALAFLGISLIAWEIRHYRHLIGKVKWMPQPVKGSVWSLDAQWKTSEIIRLVGEVRDTGRLKVCPPPKSTDANFSGYLRRAVHNAICNVIRTKSRREKERPFDTHFQFKNWKSEDNNIPYEEMLIDHHGAETDTRAFLVIAVNKLSAATPEYKDALIADLLEGHTLKEAVNKLNVPPDTRQKLKVRLRNVLRVDLN